MSEYSGQQKQAVLTALESAAEILISLDLGPASAAALDNWQATDPETKVQAANTFLPFTEILQMFAVLDDDNGAREAYGTLCRLGALGGEKTPYMADVENECEDYLVAEYADIAAGQQRVAPMAYGTRLSDASGPRQALEAQVDSLVAKACDGDRQGVKDAYRSLADAGQRSAVKDVLYYITALQQDVYSYEAVTGNRPTVKAPAAAFQPC